MEGDWADTTRSSSSNMMVAEPEATVQASEGRTSLAQSASPPLAPIQVVPDMMAVPELVAGAKGPRAVMNGLNQMNYEVIVSYGSGNMYSIVRKLRDAIFGKVCMAFQVEQGEDGNLHIISTKPVAVKIIYKNRLSAGYTEDPLKEISVMQYVNAGGGQANVMGLIETVHDPHCIYMILPFCDGGEICGWFAQTRFNLGEDAARTLFLQILAGVKFLHSKGVIHRDMSLENLLYDKRSRRALIIDLGMCLKLPCPASSHVYVGPQGTCGKFAYMSPEIFANEGFISSAPDIWALGIILFIMLTGIPPIQTPSSVDPRFVFIKEGKLEELMRMWKLGYVSAEARDLLLNLIVVEPTRRLTIDEIYQHPWIRAAENQGGGAS